MIKSTGPGGITASASCNTFCKFNSTALVVGEAFPAPWKAVPQPFALTLHPPKAVEVPRIYLSVDVSFVLTKHPLDPSWVPGTDLSVPVTGN